jgi:O-antigen ligase
MRRFLTITLESILIVLLGGLPLSLGGVEAWGYGSMEVGVALLVLVYALRAIGDGSIRYVRTPLNLLLVAAVMFPLMQLIPLPLRALALIARPTAEIHQQVHILGAAPSGAPLAVNPDLLYDEWLKLIGYIATFFIALHLFTDERRVKRFFLSFALIGTAVAGFALVQLMFWNGKIYWRISTQSAFPFGPYINHNHFAGFMELTVGAALGLVLAELHPVLTGKIRLRDFSGARTLLLAGMCGLMVLGIVLSRSRGGVVSLVGATMILPFLVRRSDSRRAMIVALGVVALCVGGAVALGSGAVWGTYTFTPDDPSAVYRLVTWRDTLRLVRNYLLAGCGLGNFAEAFPPYKSSFSGYFIVHPENDYLQALAETGIIGFGLLVAAGGVYFRRVVQLLALRRNEQARARASGGLFGLVAFCLHGLYDFNFHIPANAFAFALLAALVLAQAALHTRATGEAAVIGNVRRLTRARSPVLFRGLASALVLGAIGLGAVAADAARNRLAFQSWFRSHRMTPPEHALRIDDRLIPGYEAEMLHWRARHLVENGQLPTWVRWQQYAFFERAAELARESVRRRPARGRYWALWAKALAELGEHELALRAFDRALALDPSNADIHYDRARYAIFLEDAETASREFATARRLNPRLNLPQMLTLLSSITTEQDHLRRLIVMSEDERVFQEWSDKYLPALAGPQGHRPR